ncbi:hypothetical protein Riv7116_6796 [Rivularia sp. PCC 7116]|uniref:hypothetical protein n=1 Tax=Rivularia sp. PCC 7116 TaxID=373994 RepID=UPI00029F2B49|nr:hypothetical protein [Rivularia sp. PCC 7116]AFY59112.1 hypothetical protein Riv7116_6796 [Rivularia sp. PCC 7116]
MSLEKLRQEYLQLTNEVLPNLAKQRQFPVRFNHCFQRIILDNLFGCCWYDVLDKRQGAAYQQLNKAQLEKAISLAKAIISQSDEYIRQLNTNSLCWRGKLKKES